MTLSKEINQSFFLLFIYIFEDINYINIYFSFQLCSCCDEETDRLMIQFFDTFSAGHHVALRPPDRRSASPLRSDRSCQFQGCFTPGISFDFPNIWQFHIWHAECVKVQTQGFIHGLQSMGVWEKETELVSSVQCSKQSCS